MIFGDMRHYEAERQTYPSFIRRGLESIRNLRLDEQEVGKYEIEEGLFALVQEPVTKPAPEQKFESHEQHVDIQYLVRGRERIGVLRHLSELKVAENYLEDQDYVLYEPVERASELVLSPGQFAVFYPWDVHKPGCSVEDAGEPIKKIVIKVHRKLWEAASVE
ncbi:YhcH/YjgK/YiaL family protein [Paenibacillus filicis]|uniref:YhcH/YjgK/YiaL family protein n=1 Tax=Paenibacillus filicis TaxID=669464 RepID=A0ABU9DG68_9BACL